MILDRFCTVTWSMQDVSKGSSNSSETMHVDINL